MRGSGCGVMTASGPIVWLQATPEELLERVGSAPGRPLLDGALAADPVFRYGEAADHVIETSGKHIAEVAEEIAALWAP